MTSHKRWTCEEDARLLAAHKEGKPIGALAKEHNRSQGAIQSRLTKHLFHADQSAKCAGLEITYEDCDHLSFIYERMAHVHHENQQVDYMLRFRRIIAIMKTLQVGV